MGRAHEGSDSIGPSTTPPGGALGRETHLTTAQRWALQATLPHPSACNTSGLRKRNAISNRGSHEPVQPLAVPYSSVKRVRIACGPTVEAALSALWRTVSLFWGASELHHGQL